MAANENPKRGTRFKPGQSGNPNGRPVGSRNATTKALEGLLEGEAQELTRKAIELGKAGDSAMLRLCIDRLLPVRKDRPIEFELPAIETSADVVKALGAVVAAVARGDLTPSEAAEISKMIDSVTRAIEVHDLAERIAKLEQGAGK